MTDYLTTAIRNMLAEVGQKRFIEGQYDAAVNILACIDDTNDLVKVRSFVQKIIEAYQLKQGVMADYD